MSSNDHDDKPKPCPYRPSVKGVAERQVTTSNASHRRILLKQFFVKAFLKHQATRPAMEQFRRLIAMHLHELKLEALRTGVAAPFPAKIKPPSTKTLKRWLDAYQAAQREAAEAAIELKQIRRQP